jgi:hypothetical protein
MAMGECDTTDPSKPPPTVSVEDMHIGMPDTTALACKEPTAFTPFGEMVKVVNTVIGVPGIYITWQEEWTAVKFNEPLIAGGNAQRLCKSLDSTQFKYCVDRPETRDWQSGAKKMHLFVILTPCAFADGGLNYAGGIYQADKYIIAAHAGAKPSFNRAKIIRFDKLGMGLMPYAYDGQSHFWVGTAPYVCTLLAVLPKDIKILVPLNAKTTPLWKMLGVDMSRFVAFDNKATYYAREMYSIAPHPYGMHGKFGAEPAGPQAYARMMKTLFKSSMPTLAERTKIIVISRADRSHRRLTNHVQLLQSLRQALPAEDISEFVGTKQSVAAAKQLFMHAKVPSPPQQPRPSLQRPIILSSSPPTAQFSCPLVDSPCLL